MTKNSPIHSISSQNPGGEQLTLDFSPGLTELYPSLADCVRACCYQGPPLKVLAADMDLSQSELSRKLSAHDDKRPFSIDDLERYLTVSGDMTPILYLAAKFGPIDKERRKQAARAQIASLVPMLMALAKDAS